MLHKSARTVDNEFVIAVSATAPLYRIGNILRTVFHLHRNGNHNLFRLAVTQGHLRFDVKSGIADVIQMLADFLCQIPVFRHIIRSRGVDRHTVKDALVSISVSIYPLGNVRRLLTDVLCNDKVITADGIFFSPAFLILFGIANLIYRSSDKGGNILLGVVSLTGNFSAESDMVIFDLHLNREPGVGITVKVAVQQIAGNIIGDFVRVAEGNPFRSFKHGSTPIV